MTRTSAFSCAAVIVLGVAALSQVASAEESTTLASAIPTQRQAVAERSAAPGFAALAGVEAEPLTSAEMADVQGTYWTGYWQWNQQARQWNWTWRWVP